jgi:hypothetical protein
MDGLCLLLLLVPLLDIWLLDKGRAPRAWLAIDRYWTREEEDISIEEGIEKRTGDMVVMSIGCNIFGKRRFWTT